MPYQGRSRPNRVALLLSPRDPSGPRSVSWRGSQNQGGGECQRPGEVRYKGIIRVCGPHAALLQLEDRAQAVLGSVFRMDGWLEENGSSGADEEYLGRI